ncbi:MAG: EAL domain-containing protein, partial [Sulfurimonas sp.]|nr:EAL domain-containing protein [Sulfurimonas sp.]
FAKKMGIQVIAEFVENKEIFEKVKELGIEKSQGYYFSEPKPFLI